MHRTSLLAAFAALTLTGVACDSPGGGSGAVNCDVLPSSPICQAGGTDAAGSDTSTTPPQDTLPAADTTPAVDTGPQPDTAGGETCTSEGARRCDGATAQQCTGGRWSDLFACPASKVCEAGFCVDPGSGCTCAGKACGDDGCGNLCGSCGEGTICENHICVAQQVCDCGGATCGFDNCGNSCGTCANGWVCQGGQCMQQTTCSCNGAVCGFDNCGNSCGTCANGTACQGGQCVAVGGSASCVDIVGCIYDPGGCIDLSDQSQQTACQESCYNSGSTTAQSEFDSYVACAANCGSDNTCFWNQCSTPQAACFFDQTGFGGCWGILECMDTCGNNEACITGCYEQATLTAQAALLALNGCINAQCPAGSAQSCVDAAAQGACASYLAQCQNN